GALRMRAYRLASSLVYESPDDQHWQKTKKIIDEFKQNLQHPDLVGILPENLQHPLRASYSAINQQWTGEIQPLFEIYLEGIEDSASDNSTGISEGAVINLRNRYFQVVLNFVENIDRLIDQLKKSSESKIQELRVYLFFALTLTVILVTTALILVYRRVHYPVQQLLKAAKLARKRDFSYRTDYMNNDEPGQLCQAFNSMAEDLSKIYNELEDRVQLQTVNLKQSNRSIELLYTVVKRLNEAPFPQTTFAAILKDIEKLLDARHGVICLNNQAQTDTTMFPPTLITSKAISHLCKYTNWQKYLKDGKIQRPDLQANDNEIPAVFCLPISDQNQQYGVLIIELKQNTPIALWQQQLLESIAGHIATAMRLSQQAVEVRRLALMQERSVIARELHDSLAQSLTFMKIQVSRLQSILKNTEANSEANDVLLALKEGLNSAYRELRELLTTFRLKIDGNDFNDALKKTVVEFNERSKTRIKSINQLNNNDLTPNEEIHILQIIREALSNIVQHSDASTAHLALGFTHTDDIQLTIEDNGRGLSTATFPAHHYGLSIMKARARTLNAEFNITSTPHSGTKIELFFPSQQARPSKQTNSLENT
ncbi:Nitrate/nitrite sensor protein NarQ, partial [hydrothermal vent metagenome]